MDAVLLTISDGRIAAANPAACAMFGMTEAEICAAGRDGLVDTTDPGLVAFIEERERAGRARGELRHKRKDGSTFIGDVFSVRLENGLSACVTIRDITAEKEAQEKIRTSQNLLQAVVEGTSHAVFVKNGAGRHLLFNPAAEQITGKNAKEVLGRDDRAIFPTAAAKRIMKHDRQVMATGENITFEEELPDTRGNPRIFLTTKGPLRDSAGKITGVFGIARDITDIKRAEAELRESEERFRLVFNQQFQFMAILSPDGVVLEINELPLRVQGYSREDYVGKPFWQSPSWRDLPEWRQIWPARLARAAQMDGPLLTEDVFQTRNGLTRFADAATTAARDKEGRIKYFIIQAVDTTERRKAEEALRQSEQRFQLVNRATNEVIWDLDLTTGKIVWTGAVQNTFGFTPEEFSPILAVWEDHLHPEDRARVVAGLRAAIESDAEKWSDEYRFCCKDGSYGTFLDRGFIVRENDGRAVRMIGSMLDITERKRLEAERDRLTGELEAIIDFLPEGLVFYGSAGEILRLNPAAGSLLDGPPEFIDKPFAEQNAGRWREDRDGEPIPVEDLPVARALRNEVVRAETMAYTRPDGRVLWLNTSAAPIYSTDGRLLGAVAIYSDISRLRQLQEEKEGYLHTITHDLRTPLTVIQGHAEMLRPEVEKSGLGEIPRINIDAIETACGQMAGMMEDLSEMARLEGGKLNLQPEAIDLGQFVADYLRRSQVAMDVSRVIAEIPSGLPAVWADPRSLERCLGNLVGNALKYSKEGSPVRVRAGQQGDELVISVVDEGSGIRPEDLPYVFDRFFRARHVSKQGIGLGLFITRSLVEANDGRIWAESEPGRGSTFYFSLPVAGAGMQERHRPSPAPWND